MMATVSVGCDDGRAPCSKPENSQSEPKRSCVRLSMLRVESVRAHFRLEDMVNRFVSYGSDPLTTPWPFSMGDSWPWAPGQVFMSRP